MEREEIKGSTFCKFEVEILMGLGVCFLSFGQFCYNPVRILFFLATGCYNRNIFLWDIAEITSVGLCSSIIPLAFPNDRIPIL